MFSVRTLSNGDFLYWDGQRVDYVASPHKNAGFASGRRRFLIMHYTAGSTAASSASWFANPASETSAHVVVDRDGSVIQSVPFSDRAWHAGRSTWRDGDGNRLDGLNQFALGIELANAGACRRTSSGQWRNNLGVLVDASNVIEAEHRNGAVFFAGNPQFGVASGSVGRPGWEVYPEAQIRAATAIARTLVRHYDLEDIMGHDDVSPGRKSDPGPLFDIAEFADLVDGLGVERPNTWHVRAGTPDGLAIRVGPSKDFAKVREENLPVGTEVAFIQAAGVWWHVTVLDGDGRNELDGWVHSSYLARS